jgi:phage baseplate assembly protein W
MGLQMTIPFTVLPNGSVSVETNNDIQVGQRVNALVATEVGQRPMRAALGLPLSQLLFGVSDDLVIAQLRDQVTQQLNSYEPGISVLSVTPVTTNSKDGVAEIKVNYRPVLQGSAANAASNTVVIEVGGTVKEVTINGNS